MIEIYNEKVQDLLSLTNTKQSKDGLQVRDDPQKGIYVQDQNFVPVSSAEQILAQLDKGNEARTIGSTNMNATSSRAHTKYPTWYHRPSAKFVGAPQKSHEGPKKSSACASTPTHALIWLCAPCPALMASMPNCHRTILGASPAKLVRLAPGCASSAIT